MSSDRNLLFGVLALRENLVDARRFAEACRLWAERESGSLADVLLEKGWICSEDRARLDTWLAGLDAEHPTQAMTPGGAANPRRTHTPAGPGAADDAGLADALALARAARPGAGPESRYRVSRLHAEGGLGRVWLARDTQLHRDVALKELRPEVADRPRVRSRFLQEAAITGQLEHPGIVPVYELVRRPESGPPFYAMRLVRGRTLAEAAHEYHARRREGRADPLGLVALLSAFVAVCQTVAYAHSRCVVHRDLKGENVLLGDFGEVIVLDWGVAKVLGAPEEGCETGPDPAAAADRTVQGEVIGTPAYMSPEQAEGRLDRIDRRTDIYGLGALLYEVLTGRPPFTGPNTLHVLQQVLHGDPAPPHALWPEVPAALEAICLKALSKDPAGRHGSAADLAQEVQAWQEVQRRQAEEALRRQTEILQSILDNMGESLVVVDARGELLLANPAAGRMLGVRAADATFEEGLRGAAFLPDGVTPYPPDRLPLARALRGESVDDAELFVVPPGESAGRYVSANARPLRDAAGAPRGALMVLRDVTERKQAEEELRRSRERFELAVAGSQDGLWDWDLKTNEVYYSPRWKSILGYEDHEIRHHLDEWSARLHPDERERVLAANYAHIDGATPYYEYEYRLRHKDGSYRWILARGVALRDAGGKAYRMAGSHVDITEWKGTERALRESEARGRALAESAPGGVVVVDAGGAVRACNGEAARLLGVPAGGLARGSLADLARRAVRRGGRALTEEEFRAAVLPPAGRPAAEAVVGFRGEGGGVSWVRVAPHPVCPAGEASPSGAVLWLRPAPPDGAEE
jgi:PAS domain S-box-containing protein